MDALIISFWRVAITMTIQYDKLLAKKSKALFTTSDCMYLNKNAANEGA